MGKPGFFKRFKTWRKKQTGLYPITERVRVRVNAYCTHLSQKEAERLVSLELSYENSFRLTRKEYAEMHALQEKFNKAVK